jgi:hypothetical protein
MYYFPVESVTEPRSDGVAYASKSLFETGEWLGRLQYDPRRKIRFVLGIEREFPGREPIVRNFKEALGKHFEIHDSLEETVKVSISRTMKDDWRY